MTDRQDLTDAYRRADVDLDRAAADVRRLARRYASWRRSYRAQFGDPPATLIAVWRERIDTARRHCAATCATRAALALALIASEEERR